MGAVQDSMRTKGIIDGDAADIKSGSGIPGGGILMHACTDGKRLKDTGFHACHKFGLLGKVLAHLDGGGYAIVWDIRDAHCELAGQIDLVVITHFGIIDILDSKAQAGALMQDGSNAEIDAKGILGIFILIAEAVERAAVAKVELGMDITKES